MVYRGKPSKGCETCRKRRVHCDRRSGGCFNCQRLGKHCTGYRNDIDLQFVNETDHVLQRHGGGLRPSNRSATKIDETACHIPYMTALAVSNARFASPPLDSFALSYCYYWHVVRPDSALNTSIKVHDEKLLSCMKAVGMASFSMATRLDEHTIAARQYYIDAVHSTNAALMSADDAAKDSTLLAVITLSLFESITGDDAQSMEAWSRHVQGTAALLELRGLDQMWTAQGRFLYTQAITTIVARCFRLGLRIPAIISKLTEEFLKHADDPNDYMWRASGFKIRLVNLQADAKHATLSELATVVEQALQLDCSFKEVMTELASARMTAEQADADAPEVVGKRPTSSRHECALVQLWRSLLTGRIQCHAILLAASKRNGRSRSFDINPSQIDMSRQTIHDLQLDVLESIPRDFGVESASSRGPQSETHSIPSWTPDKFHAGVPYDYFRVANLAMLDLPVMQTVMGSALLSQLTILGKTAEPGSHIRLAACDVLRGIGRVTRMSQAFLVADELQANGT